MTETKKEILTLDKLKELPSGIFASGNTFIVHPWFNNAKFLFNEKHELWDGSDEYGVAASKGYMYVNVNWVAIRGSYHDWAIYHSLDANLEPGEYLDGVVHLLASNDQIARSGAKLHTEAKIKELVPCDDEAFEFYRD